MKAKIYKYNIFDESIYNMLIYMYTYNAYIIYIILYIISYIISLYNIFNESNCIKGESRKYARDVDHMG